MVRGCRHVEKMHARYAPTPFLSCVIDNCLEKGRDVTNGGSLYNFSGIQGVQPANIADSLEAIKKILFEDKLMSANELNDLLDRNFLGNEEMRQFFLNSIPKYGNDVESVDGLAQRWARKFCKAVEKYKNWRGGIFQPGFYTVSSYIPMGAVVGATPDGRKAKAPLADGGLSPMRGVDLKGPTAVLKSVSKIDLMLASNGSLLNMKFSPSFFEGEKALELFASFLRTFVDLKIQHIQFNVVSTETLRSAQKEPHNYHGLVVRVAGYSAFFVELAKELQEEIILRTAYSGS
jgi:formate C-acetyltransferase